MGETSTANAPAQILTENKMGLDMGHPSYRSEAWVACYDPAKPELPIADIGCGLGTNALSALSRGARVIAVDMTESHLEKVRAKAGDAAVVAGQLQTRFGKLPDDVPLKDGEVAGILCAQVIHFLDPEAVDRSFQTFYRCLAPGGKLVVLACSHFMAMNYLTGKIAAIEEAMARDPEGPHGYAPGGQEHAGAMIHSLLDKIPPELKASMPDPSQPFQTFSDVQLTATARRAGFAVLECALCDGQLSNYPVFLKSENPEQQGREQVVLVAQKPAA